MFENMGKKIKALAKTTCRIGIIISFIVGVILLSNGNGVALIVIVIGALGSWIGSFFTYGFGELIEKATETAENTKFFTYRFGELLKKITEIEENTKSLNSANVDTDDKLELLKKWKAQGLIDENEYLEQKSKL